MLKGVDSCHHFGAPFERNPYQAVLFHAHLLANSFILKFEFAFHYILIYDYMILWLYHLNYI